MQGVWRRGETLTSPAAAAAAVLIKVILASSASSDIQFSLHFVWLSNGLATH
jgi:hypothetical protein